MNTFRFSEEQRQLWVMDKYTRRKTVRRICTEAGISRATLYNWMNEFPPPPELQNADEFVADKEVKDESFYPKHEGTGKYEMMVAALKQMDTDRALSRKMVQAIVKRYTLSVSQACAIVGMDEEAYGYKPRKPEVDDEIVHQELARLTQEEPSRGFIDCYKILQRTHPKWTRKQIKRVYREQRLYLRRIRVRRTKTETKTEEQLRLHRYSTVWNLGMVERDGHWLLFILDEQDNVPLNAASGIGEITDEAVLSFLTLAMNENGKPRKLRIPGKTPFNSKEVTRWVWEHKAALQTLNLAKPENEEEVNVLEAKVAEEVFTRPVGDEAAMRDAAEAWIQRGVNAYK